MFNTEQFDSEQNASAKNTVFLVYVWICRMLLTNGRAYGTWKRSDGEEEKRKWARKSVPWIIC